MKRVAAGAHLPTPWLSEPAKRPDDRADYCLDCSSSPSGSTGYSFLHLGGVGRALWANSGEGSAQYSLSASETSKVPPNSGRETFHRHTTDCDPGPTKNDLISGRWSRMPSS